MNCIVDSKEFKGLIIMVNGGRLYNDFIQLIKYVLIFCGYYT